MRYPKVLPVFFVVIATLPTLAVAQGTDDSADEDNKSQPKVKLSGFMRSQFEAENFKDGELFHEARVEFKTKRQRGLRANIEVDFRTKTDDVQVNEALLDKKFDGGLRLKAGYDLKRFGLEYQEARLERPTIERSLIYRKMDLFNYTGHETIVMMEKGGEAELFHDWSLGASFSEAQNTSLVGNYQIDINPAVRYGLWLQAGTHRIQDGQVMALALMNSLWHRDSEKLWQAEWVIGVDPNQTEYESVFDDDERIYFSGINLLYGRYFWNDGDESMMAQVGLTEVSHDHRELKYNSLGCFLGLRYDIGTLRLALNAELIGTNSPIDLKKRTYDESSARLEALFAF